MELKEKQVCQELYEVWKGAREDEDGWPESFIELPEKHQQEYLLTAQRILSLTKPILLIDEEICEDRPKIVCLCGSGRFKQAFDDAEFNETLSGKIVLTIGCNTHDVARSEELKHYKPLLDELHKHKIDLADEILVLNVGGYIGESTHSEIEYAEAHGKPVRYLEPVAQAQLQKMEGKG
jgi:hypothetical protein